MWQSRRSRLLSIYAGSMALAATETPEHTKITDEDLEAVHNGKKPKRVDKKPQGVRINDPRTIPADKSKSLKKLLARKGRK